MGMLGVCGPRANHSDAAFYGARPMVVNAEYAAYLESEEWKAKRLLVLERAGYRCEALRSFLGWRGEVIYYRCANRRLLHVHHLTYDRVFDEPLEDLMALCPEDHDRAHGL